MGNNNKLIQNLMRSLFTAAVLAIGAYASNSKAHGPWDIMTGSQADVKMGTLAINTDWAKTGG